MVSHTSKYALKALHFISKTTIEGDKLPAMEISRRTGIPKPFLSKMLKHLASLGFVSSSKGPRGGFYLDEDQMNRSVLDVLVQLEGKDSLRNCILNFDACNEEKPCPIHILIADEKSRLRASIQNIRISDLSDDLSYLQ